MFLVKCPKCGHNMNCAPRIAVVKAKKKCVFCGYNFMIHSSIQKSRIVKKI